MSQQHYPQKRGGISFFNLMGFAFAAILAVGMLSKAGFKLEAPGSDAVTGSNISKAEIPSDSDLGETPIRLSESLASRAYENSPSSYEDRPVSSNRSSSAGRITAAPEEWIGHFAEAARQQALQNGVPAGITLAVGLSHVQNGAVIENSRDFVERIVKPLLEIKHQSPQEQVQTYFKYSANSERWAEGLGRSGEYSERQLKQLMDDYGLSAFDKNVRNALLNASAADKEVERKASFVADEVASSVRRKKEAESRRSQSPELRSNPRAEDSKDLYNEVVGHEVAKSIAEKKLKSGKYLTDKDMERLIKETDAETTKAMQNNLGFMGRKINKNHPEAEKMLDVSKPENAQARQELYQERLKAMRKKDGQR